MIYYKRDRKPLGFSLIEVLLVLALVGVLAGLVAGNVGAFIKGAQYEPPDRVLKKAILDATYHASESKNATFLSYDAEKAEFLISNSNKELLSKHSVYKGEWKDDYESPEIIFQAIGPESGAGGGATLYDEEELELSRVALHYGSSVPFLTKLRFRGESSDLFFDPFSGYLLKKSD